MRSRFLDWRSGPRAAVLAALAAALLILAMQSSDPSSAPSLRSGEVGQSDASLYRTIVARVRAGEPYYPATAAALREGHYPLRPFITFRLPTVTWFHASFGQRTVPLMQWGLAVGVAAAWGYRLWPEVDRPTLVLAVLLLWTGTLGLVEQNSSLFGESWAAMLVASALALDRRRWLPAALVAGLAAMLFRVLSALAIMILAITAWLAGQRKEAIAWLAVAAIFGVVMVLHASQVAAVVRADDLVSPGWAGLLGPAYFLRALAAVTPLGLLPPALASTLLILSWFGWWSIPTEWALRSALMIGGYGLLVALFARADTFYWAMMVAPLSLVGLAFVPAALRDLVRPRPNASR